MKREALLEIRQEDEKLKRTRKKGDQIVSLKCKTNTK